MIFSDYTINVGRRVSRRVHDSTRLVPAAVEVFRSLLDGGNNFRRPLPVADFAHLELQWTEATPGAAMATFWKGKTPLTTSALLSGTDAEADREAAGALQQLQLQVYSRIGLEAGFEIDDIRERPVILSVPFPWSATDPDTQIVADAETCLAAAYFAEVESRG